MGSLLERTWTWEFALPPEALWPVLADTVRFNEAAGFPRYELLEKPRPDGSVERIGTARLGPFRLSWAEGDFDFVAGRGFTQRRRFLRGPVRGLEAHMALEPTGAGTSVFWRLRLEASNLLVAESLRLAWLPHTGRILDRLVRDGAAFAAGQRAVPYDLGPPHLGDGAARLRNLAAKLDHPLKKRLIEFLSTAPDVDVARIRPRRLARLWNAGDRDVIELCLAATKGGILDLHWGLLCPRCRGAKAIVASLDALPKGAHCQSCNIDYGRDFVRNVEASFRPTPSVRSIAVGGFCLSSPVLTPHVAVQQRLAPGETRRLDLALPAGRWRVRTLEPGEALELDHPGGALPEIAVEGAALRLGSESGALRNAGAVARTVVVESREWAREALTAHEVTTLQLFRDLFGAETLRPGDDVAIEQVTLMFTDLRGSTALYGRLGDARAYGLVREHFAYLAAAIRHHDGAIVKTIGDAVMAAFADPADAVRAALDVQRGVAAFNRSSGWSAICIKLGLHAGPCIAVTLNDRLDYFGSTVNLAARLQGRSEGDDLVLSASLAEDPAVAPLLGDLGLEEETARLKGFEAPVRLFRLRTVDVAKPVDASAAGLATPAGP
jgi:class 3 adenylate cyclase